MRYEPGREQHDLFRRHGARRPGRATGATVRDLFLCEATLLPGETEGGGVRGHSSAAEAATMAQRAGVERLVLTHYSSDTTPDQLLFEAKKSFDGAIRIADDNILIE